MKSFAIVMTSIALLLTFASAAPVAVPVPVPEPMKNPCVIPGTIRVGTTCQPGHS
ncbi:hypothetical protein TWF694_007674 [Orbilia ellipsospora]|uniref:Uncharacterized protein n=1 Tax=Orbilia ellipsospora TaxID=2528407 RepID=A0AAV9XLT8_9PEZI